MGAPKDESMGLALVVLLGDRSGLIIFLSVGSEKRREKHCDIVCKIVQKSSNVGM